MGELRSYVFRANDMNTLIWSNLLSQQQIRHADAEIISKLLLSPKTLLDFMGKIKLQLHTFLPMMSWKCMLTAWSTDCSASKVINPKPSQRPRVNQGSREGEGCDNTRWRTVSGFSSAGDPSRPSKRPLGFGGCCICAKQHNHSKSLKDWKQLFDFFLWVCFVVGDK